jgi:hypothetical protein
LCLFNDIPVPSADRSYDANRRELGSYDGVMMHGRRRLLMVVQLSLISWLILVVQR